MIFKKSSRIILTKSNLGRPQLKIMSITLETSILLNLIEEARGYEKIRDLESEAKILQNFWTDFEFDPEIDDLAPAIRAEIFRLCGKFLSAYGKAKGKSDYQERGKDLLFKSIELFTETGNEEKAALAKCQIALSYYYDGRSSSADAVLSEAERFFRLDKSNPYFLEIKINHLIALSKLEKINDCLEVIDFVAPRLESCVDPYLHLMFFNQCGFVFNIAGKHELAEKSFSRAMKTAEVSGNRRAVGQISNNLAFTSRKLGELFRAYDYVRRAIIVAESLKDYGWMANYLDTKASIELELGDLLRALETIELSVKFLSETEDVISHIESLNTKIDILFALGKSPQALIVYSKLNDLILKEYGETEADRLAETFARKMSESANRVSAVEIISDGAEISRFELAGEIEVFNLPKDDFRLFHVPAKKAQVLGFDEDVIVCALVQKKPNPIVMSRFGDLLMGDLVKDDEIDLIVLYTGKNRSDPICTTPDEAEIEGSVFAVALAKSLNENFLYFENLER